MNFDESIVENHIIIGLGIFGKAPKLKPIRIQKALFSSF